MNPQETVRAFFHAVKIETASPPYDTMHLKVYYPAQVSGDAQETNLGMIPPDSELAPFPVVIFFNGVNCSPEGYQWLAIDLAKRGLVIITFAWVAENIPGFVALTPGVDLNAWSSDNYGKMPTASALPTLLSAIADLQEDSLLSGRLDLNKIILGGHSAGGRVAIESASPDFSPQLAGAFAYAAHTAVGKDLGYEPGTILPIPNSLPLLLMGGTRDGVIVNSSYRYGVQWETATTPILRTFQGAIAAEKKESYLVFFQGANHFSLTYPHDSTAGTSFLDFPPTESETELRPLMAIIIGLFIKGCICQEKEALNKLHNLLNSDHPLVAKREYHP